MAVRSTRVSVSKRGDVQLHVLLGKTWTGVMLEDGEADQLIDDLSGALLRKNRGKSP